MPRTTDRVFKALADPSRQKLLDRLYARNGVTVSELCKQTGMSRQAVAQHLEILEGANLISTISPSHGRPGL